MSDNESDVSVDDSSKRKFIVLSNKTMNENLIPAKPQLKKARISESYCFRMVFTNGILLRKFLEPAANAVKKMRFVIKIKDPFTGFKIECHDQGMTLADIGVFECDVLSHEHRNANGETFCVLAESFMEALMSSTLKETDLCITRYDATPDIITFESVNNENDVRTIYTCGLVETSQVQALDNMSIPLGFHVNVHMGTLKELSLNAKRCNAPSLIFDLSQCKDTADPTIIHSRLSIGFKGPNTSGLHDFFISSRRIQRGDEIVWEPITGRGFDSDMLSAMEKRSSNEYDNKKLRLFLNHMESNWVLVHICNDNTTQPLVLECILGGTYTKHTVIVGPKEPQEF